MEMSNHIKNTGENKELNRLKNTLQLFEGKSVNKELADKLFPSAFNTIDGNTLKKLLDYYSVTIETTGVLRLIKLTQDNQKILKEGLFEEIVEYIEDNYESLFGKLSAEVCSKFNNSKEFIKVHPDSTLLPQNNKLLPQLENMSSLIDIQSELNKTKLFEADFLIKEV